MGLEVVLERTNELELSRGRSFEEKRVPAAPGFAPAGTGVLPQEGAIGAVRKSRASPSKTSLTERLF